ncbi:unnamed protein product [Rotaria magnacalcarata]|uniref:Uncharacterized protein n=1 Tax=Rotaria magnacalcarata TaxID=392030 RepID=A0A816V1A2_9BILA|nr:unnamed protein product [Rotaria magnacalcarata]
MNKLIQRVNDINELEKNINEYDIKMNIMERRLDYFKTALESSSTYHSLFSLLDSTSPVVLAADFLQTACKTTLLHQSEQLDDELRNTLKIYRTARQPTVGNILKNLVDLCQYLSIDYIESSLLTKLKDRLSELCNNFTTEKCQEFLNHIDAHFLIDETSSSCSELTIRALSIENQFNEYIQTINQEITKVSELQIFIHQSSTDVTFYKNLLDTKLQGK